MRLPVLSQPRFGEFNDSVYTHFHESVAPCLPAFRLLSLLPLAAALLRD